MMSFLVLPGFHLLHRSVFALNFLKANVVRQKRFYSSPAKNLRKKYGEPIVSEAYGCVAKSVKNETSPENFWRLVAEVSSSLETINQKNHWKSFKFDPARCNEKNYYTVEEAATGVACEQQGLISGPLVRDPSGRGEFIDTMGLVWDVKTARSCNCYGEHIFSASKFICCIQKELRGRSGESVLLDITKLNPGDRKKLYKELQGEFSKKELKRIAIVHRTRPSLSIKSAARLLAQS